MLFQPYEAKCSQLLRQQTLLLQSPSNPKQNHFSLTEGLPTQALASFSNLRVTIWRLQWEWNLIYSFSSNFRNCGTQRNQYFVIYDFSTLLWRNIKHLYLICYMSRDPSLAAGCSMLRFYSLEEQYLFELSTLLSTSQCYTFICIIVRFSSCLGNSTIWGILPRFVACRFFWIISYDNKIFYFRVWKKASNLI